MKFGSSNVDDFKYGSSQVDKIYQGSDVAWEPSIPGGGYTLTVGKSDTTLYGFRKDEFGSITPNIIEGEEIYQFWANNNPEFYSVYFGLVGEVQIGDYTRLTLDIEGYGELILDWQKDWGDDVYSTTDQTFTQFLVNALNTDVVINTITLDYTPAPEFGEGLIYTPAIIQYGKDHKNDGGYYTEEYNALKAAADARYNDPILECESDLTVNGELQNVPSVIDSITDDGRAAMYCALIYRIDDNVEYGEYAVEILRTWGEKVHGLYPDFTPNEDWIPDRTAVEQQLQRYGTYFIEAADLLRHTPLWDTDVDTKFNAYFQDVLMDEVMDGQMGFNKGQSQPNSGNHGITPWLIRFSADYYFGTSDFETHLQEFKDWIDGKAYVIDSCLPEPNDKIRVVISYMLQDTCLNVNEGGGKASRRIEPTFPYELWRAKKADGYSCIMLMDFVATYRAIYNAFGVNLFEWETGEGYSLIGLAAEYYRYRESNGEGWPFYDISQDEFRMEGYTTWRSSYYDIGVMTNNSDYITWSTTKFNPDDYSGGYQQHLIAPWLLPIQRL